MLGDESLLDSLMGNDQAATIDALKNERRSLLQQQQLADEIKARICDDLWREKQKVAGLTKRVKAIEATDPELYQYIQRLEFVNGGIWCPKCNAIKTVGNPMPSEVVPPAVNDVSTDGVDAARLNELVVVRKRAEKASKALTKQMHNMRDMLEHAWRLNEELLEKIGNLTPTANESTMMTADYLLG
jgi:hypothetical protein